MNANVKKLLKLQMFLNIAITVFLVAHIGMKILSAGSAWDAILDGLPWIGLGAAIVLVPLNLRELKREAAKVKSKEDSEEDN